MTERGARIVSRRLEWVLITLVLALAAALRLWALGVVPPGLAHDEVANWLIARDILDGHHALYFTAAYGHEPLYQYAQAATVALFGDHWLGLRYPSVALGLLGLAATYVLIRRLFGAPTALLTGAWLALSFWPLFYARVALRAIALPLTASLSAYFLFRAINLPVNQPTNRPADQPTSLPPTVRPRSSAPDRPRSALSARLSAVGVGVGTVCPTVCGRRRRRLWLLAGLFLGLSLYTYMAARVLPFILIAFLIYFYSIRSRTPVPWFHLLLFLLVTLVISAPLVAWLLTHPGAEYRVAEVQEPLVRLLAGDPSLIWQNLVANLKFFTLSGDPWPRQNLPGRPVFADPISALLFYTGLLVAVRRWRIPGYGFLLICLAGSLVPSIVTSVAPSSIRDILGLVVVFAFPAIALVEAGRWVKRRTQDAGCRMQNYRFVLLASCFLLLAPGIFLTVRDYFFFWPRHDVVRFDYQAGLTAVAHRLDELPPGTPATVAGLSVHTMDGPGLDLAARRDLRDVRLCDTRETLVIPAERAARLFVPRVVPLDVDLQERLMEWGALEETAPRSAFVSYRLPDVEAIRSGLQRIETQATLPGDRPVALPISFGGQMAFLGYEWTRPTPVPGDSANLLTYWRVEAPPSDQLKIFVHLLAASNTTVSQHDGLGSPPRRWAVGDLIVQKHVLALPADLPPGLYKLLLGVYNAPAGPRLSVAGADRLLLAPIEVNAPRQNACN